MIENIEKKIRTDVDTQDVRNHNPRDHRYSVEVEEQVVRGLEINRVRREFTLFHGTSFGDFNRMLQSILATLKER